MDTLAHGLWGGAAFGGRGRRMFWAAFLCGTGPDLFSFGVFFAHWALRGFPEVWSRAPGEPPNPERIPAYVSALYDVTHSLPVFALLLLGAWILFRREAWPFLAWGLHILCDIPTHTTRFFPTPYLWPLPTPYVNGIHWTHPVFMTANYLLITAALWWRWRLARSRNVLTDSSSG